MALFIPDVAWPYIEGREAAIDANYSDWARDQDLYKSMMDNEESWLNLQARRARQGGVMAANTEWGSAMEKYAPIRFSLDHHYSVEMQRHALRELGLDVPDFDMPEWGVPGPTGAAGGGGGGRRSGGGGGGGDRRSGGGGGGGGGGGARSGSVPASAQGGGASGGPAPAQGAASAQGGGAASTGGAAVPPPTSVPGGDAPAEGNPLGQPEPPVTFNQPIGGYPGRRSFPKSNISPMLYPDLDFTNPYALAAAQKQHDIAPPFGGSPADNWLNKGYFEKWQKALELGRQANQGNAAYAEYANAASAVLQSVQEHPERFRNMPPELQSPEAYWRHKSEQSRGRTGNIQTKPPKQALPAPAPPNPSVSGSLGPPSPDAMDGPIPPPLEAETPAPEQAPARKPFRAEDHPPVFVNAEEQDATRNIEVGLAAEQAKAESLAADVQAEEALRQNGSPGQMSDAELNDLKARNARAQRNVQALQDALNTRNTGGLGVPEPLTPSGAPAPQTTPPARQPAPQAAPPAPLPAPQTTPPAQQPAPQAAPPAPVQPSEPPRRPVLESLPDAKADVARLDAEINAEEALRQSGQPGLLSDEELAQKRNERRRANNMALLGESAAQEQGAPALGVPDAITEPQAGAAQNVSYRLPDTPGTGTEQVVSYTLRPYSYDLPDLEQPILPLQEPLPFPDKIPFPNMPSYAEGIRNKEKVINDILAHMSADQIEESLRREMMRAKKDERVIEHVKAQIQAKEVRLWTGETWPANAKEMRWHQIDLGQSSNILARAQQDIYCLNEALKRATDRTYRHVNKDRPRTTHVPPSPAPAIMKGGAASSAVPPHLTASARIQAGISPSAPTSPMLAALGGLRGRRDRLRGTFGPGSGTGMA
jgi:hypothetical protein